MLSRLKLRHVLWVLSAITAVTVMACSGSPSSPTTGVPSGTAATAAAPTPPTGPAPGPSSPARAGTLHVRITDSPFTDATALLISFSEVSAHTSGGDWVTLPFADGATMRTCDLKQLVGGAEDVLGTGPLAEGHYTQLRLTVSSAMIYFKTEAPVGACAPSITIPATLEEGTPVVVPSGTVKLVREFDVPGAGATTILLDLDGDQSVHQTGNGKYMMVPVIKILSVQ